MKWRALGKWVLGLALLAVIFFLGDVRELAHLRVTWVFVLGMFLVTLAFILLHTLRWKKIVDAVSERQDRSFWSFFEWMLHSYALGYIMPKDVSLLSVRTYYLKQHHQLPLPASLFSVTLDRLLDFIVFFVVITPALLFITRILSPTESALVTGVLFAVLLLGIRWKGRDAFGLLVRLYQLILGLPILRNRVPVGQDLGQWKDSLGGRDFPTMMSWTTGAYLLLCLRFFFTGMALDIRLSFLQSLFLVPVIQVSGLINITPAGLGVLELGSWGALFLIGFPKDEILRFVVGQRVLLTVVLLSLILLNHLFLLLKGRWQRAGARG